MALLLKVFTLSIAAVPLWGKSNTHLTEYQNLTMEKPHVSDSRIVQDDIKQKMISMFGSGRKAIKCPECKQMFASFSDDSGVVSEHSATVHVLSHRCVKIVCNKCIDKQRMKDISVFVCLECERQNRRQHKLCKCAKSVADNACVGVVATEGAMGQVNTDARGGRKGGTVHESGDVTMDGIQINTVGQEVNEHQLKGGTDPDTGENYVEDQDMDVDVDEGAFDANNDDAKDDNWMNFFQEAHADTPTKRNTTEIIKAGSFNPRYHFTAQNGFTRNSSIYFINQHEAGTGLKSIVWRSQKDHKRVSDFDRLSDYQASLTLLAVTRFANMSKNSAIDVCTMMKQVADDHKARFVEDNNAYKSAVRHVLTDHFESAHIERIMAEIDSNFTSLRVRNVGVSLPDILDEPDVRSHYTTGPNSFMNMLPRPQVHVAQVQGSDCKFAYVNADETLNHMLAHGSKCHIYRAGYPDDWKEETYLGDENDERKRTRMSEFFRSACEKAKAMVDRGELLPDDRVVMLRCWSDGFEAHNVAGNNKYNSLQVYTLRLKGPTDQICPFGLCFKEDRDSSVFIRMLEEVTALRNPKFRYFGRDRTLFRTVAFVEFISQDYPERCESCHISQKGNYSKRWGHSVQYKANNTPTCADCLRRRKTIILNNKCDDEELGQCTNKEKCSDWWAKVDSGDQYPVRIGFDILEKDAPAVKLSLKMIYNGLKEAFDWQHSNLNKKGTGPAQRTADPLKKFLQWLTLNNSVYSMIRGMATWEEIMNEYPLLAKFQDMEIELDQFPSMPMHLFFLGITKSIMDVAKLMKVVNYTSCNQFWSEFRPSVKEGEDEIGRLAIEWCSLLGITGEDEKKLGHANWQSNHCVAFTRIILYQMSGLDHSSTISQPALVESAVSAYRRMLVLWFCVASNAFTTYQGSTSATRLDHLIRLFLSACNDFHVALVDGQRKHADDVKARSKAKAVEKAERDKARAAATAKKTNKSTKSKPAKKTLSKKVTVTKKAPKSKKAKKTPAKKATATKAATTDAALLTTTGINSDKEPATTTSKSNPNDVDYDAKNPFFGSKANFYSLLNSKDIIEKFGCLGYIWEGKDERYIQQLKRSLNILRKDTSYLKTLLEKVLDRAILEDLNLDNPLQKKTKYARLSDFNVYSTQLHDVLQNEKYVSGIIDRSGKMYVCYEAKRNAGIDLHPIVFDDDGGEWVLNLWYAKASVGPSDRTVADRTELLNECHDEFLLLKMKDCIANSDSGKSTVICHSWRVRVNSGEFKVPMPAEEYIKE